MKCPFLLQEYLMYHIQETLKCDSNPESTRPTEGKTMYLCCWSKRMMSPAENCMSDKRLQSTLRHAWQSEEKVEGREDPSVKCE